MVGVDEVRRPRNGLLLVNQYAIHVGQPAFDGLALAAPYLLPAFALRGSVAIATMAGTDSLRPDTWTPFAADPALRLRIGAANRAKALREYDECVMISRYATLYGEAIGRPGALRSEADGN